MYGVAMKTKEKTWLTREQAAARADVSTRTIDRLLATGRLTRHRTLGRRRVMIDAHELSATMAPTPQRIAS